MPLQLAHAAHKPRLISELVNGAVIGEQCGSCTKTRHRFFIPRLDGAQTRHAAQNLIERDNIALRHGPAPHRTHVVDIGDEALQHTTLGHTAQLSLGAIQ